MGPTCLDPPRAIVVPGGGAQIAVSKQVARNSDPFRCCDRPRGCAGITAIVRSYADTEPADRVPGEDPPDR